MMKLQAALVLLSLVVLPVVGGGVASVRTLAPSNPVTRIVNLLKGLQEKLEKDLAEEKDLWETYECWYKKVTDAKTASNEAANARIDSLETYIKDIDSGKIEFTTERADLELQIGQLKRDLENAEAMRDQEKKDYEAADQEMQQAVAALDEAIQVMKDGTSLLARKQKAGLVGIRQKLHRAVSIGRSMLGENDARLLAGALDVPQWDWKKLNRKATFKMSYKARSGQIVRILEEMKESFEQNIEDADAKEADAKNTYNALKSSKGKILTSAEDALITMEKENGARGLSRSQAQDEVDDLKAQVTADTKFIGQVETSYQTKKGEWTEREKLRNTEISAISEAISVLRSDEARDTFKKSYDSQGYSFAQVLSVVSRHQGHKQIQEALQALARESNSPKLAMIAKLAQAAGPIEKVVTKIDALIATLNQEEESDLSKRDACRGDLSTNSQKARMTSIAIDDLSEDIVRAKEKAKELAAEVEGQEAIIEERNATLLEIERRRADEAKKYADDKIDDQNAVALLTQAIKVIEDMNKNFTFIQKKAPEEIVVTAGEAPPPPPATWDKPDYGGAESEKKGVTTLMAIVKSDIEKDIQLADKAETDAIAAYGVEKTALDDAISDAQTTITSLKADIGTQEQVEVDKVGERNTKKDDLDGSMGVLKSLRPGCDWILVNYDVRVRKRQVEIDGLIKAKAILQGAKFD